MVESIIDPLYTHYDMAKELGQIHTVNYTQAVGTGGPFNAINVDLPGQLSESLQTIIRCGTYHKVVGIDMSLDTVGTSGGGQVTGRIRYYAPTKGRCEAFRGAFKAMKSQMKTQGIETHTNPLYDFRAPLNDLTHLNGAFPNRATLDGLEGLALYHTTAAGSSIFEVHNANVRPTMTGSSANLFQPGFDTLLQSGSSNDFVLNDTIPYTGDRNTASLEYEEIPFMMTWTPDTTDLAIGFNWRPDPALFLAVLCGQMSVVVEEVNIDGGDPSVEVNLNVAVMVSGWKSIMGDPSKRKRRSSARKNGSSSSKKTTTTTVVKS